MSRDRSPDADQSGLLVRGEVVGAIGVSGGTADEDREYAQTGPDSLD